MKNHDVLFDKNNKRLGFVRANCQAVNEISTPQVTESDEKTPISEGEEKHQSGTDSGSNAVSRDPSPDNSNDQTRTIIIVILAGAILGLVGFFLFKGAKKQKYADM